MAFPQTGGTLGLYDQYFRSQRWARFSLITQSLSPVLARETFLIQSDAAMCYEADYHPIPHPAILLDSFLPAHN